MKRNILFLALILICCSISAQQHYPVNAHDFNVQGSMAIKCQIQINGEPKESNDIELGAFVGGEIRGSHRIDPISTSSATYYLALIQVYGNTTDLNKPITFKIYDHEYEVEYDNYEITLNGNSYDPVLTIPNSVGTNQDPVVLNFVATFTKHINPYTANGGYYLIASPIGTVSPANVSNMLVNDYDLYYFDQNGTDQVNGETVVNEWRNYEAEDSGHYLFDLEPGKGYLYANSGNDGQGVDLTFAGAPYNGDGVVTLCKVDNVSFSGWNLIGNPFAQPAVLKDANQNNMPYYVMNGAGTEIISATLGDPIPAMEGIFVIASQDGEAVTFSPVEPTKNALLTINISHDRGIVDRAILRFDEGGTLPKFQLNENSTKVYIPMDDVDYAVLRAESAGELPLYFKAASNGSYNLSFGSEEVEFSYLHLIDNMTGADVDLLVTPSYSFDARTTDYASRFKLVFVSDAGDESGNFAFFSNGCWVIANDGEAVLQVVDLNGRVLSSEQVIGCVSKSINAAAGIYMLRLVKGDDIRVQKVVVR